MMKDLYDCMITAGELDESGHHSLDNDLKVVEVAKHNVTYEQFQEWKFSSEMAKRMQELEKVGRDRFGPDYWMKYEVCYFCTTAHPD